MESNKHRYLFTVRQRFNSDPVIDCFHKLVSPSGMNADEFKMMGMLKPGWEAESLKTDSSALSGMSLRLRFNGDLYQKVLLVRSESEMSAEDLEAYVVMKFKDGDLDKFLKESTI